MTHKRKIDLRLPLVEACPDSMLREDIEHIAHEKGAQVLAPLFGGLLEHVFGAETENSIESHDPVLDRKCMKDQ